MRRDEFCSAATLFLATATIARLAQAQGFPKRNPLRLIVGSPVASATDLVVRLLADGIETSLGQRMVVEASPCSASVMPQWLPCVPASSMRHQRYGRAGTLGESPRLGAQRAGGRRHAVGA